jgi:FkbM family methyltransferase
MKRRIAARRIGCETQRMLQEARKVAYSRPIGLHPGWRFATGEDDSDPAVRRRREIWRYFQRRQLELPLEQELWNGLRMNLYLGNDLSRLLYVTGCADPNELTLLDKLLKPGMNVVDAGANEGFYTMFFAQRVGREGTVLSFEPSSREFSRLEKNIAINGLQNVRALRMALSDCDAELELRIADPEHAGQNTLGDFAYAGVEALRSERVPARRLDAVIAESGVRRVDILKVDVEGAETKVFLGAASILRDSRPVILFEKLDTALRKQNSSTDELLTLLQSSGYLIYGFHSSGRPTLAAEGSDSNNMIAVPAERPLPTEWCQAADAGEVPAGPYLSVVVTTRNDDHGGSLLRRTQTFINAFIGQCKRHGLQAELIIVEWNPPPDRPRLQDALTWPADMGPCAVRFLEVPASVHACFRHSKTVPLLQMIAKNVGIRRARGKFVLATNIDIIFSDELTRFLADGSLERGRMYRIDRHDVTTDVPVDAPVEEQLAYCETHLLRVNTREGTFPVTPIGRSRPMIGDIVHPDSNLRLGRGWYPLESDGKPFRWVGNDAEIEITASPEEPSELILDLEPGPGVGFERLELSVWDAEGVPIADARVDGRCTVGVPLPPSAEPQTVRLHCENGGITVPYDLRILNFRVFRCGPEHPVPPKEAPPAGEPQSITTPEPEPVSSAYEEPVSSEAVAPDVDVAPNGAVAPHGLLGKIAGVMRRAAENGPVIQVWVPVPRTVRRLLQFCLGIPRPVGSPTVQIETTGPEVAATAAEIPTAKPVTDAKQEVESPAVMAKPATDEEQEVEIPTRSEPAVLIAANELPVSQGNARISNGTAPRLLHTNGCGDFTLAARSDWFDLRAYPEWDLFSLHLDSVFCYAAHHAGVHEWTLDAPMRIYHIEHGKGSGWTPEGSAQLIERLRQQQVTWLDNADVTAWVDQMRRFNCTMIFNRENWGLPDIPLRETVV